MNETKQSPSRWFYSVAVLVVLLGLLISTWMFIYSGIGKYPAMITKAYGYDQHHLSAPGSKDFKLTRTGAYGIYYEYSLGSSAEDNPTLPPAIDCSLTSKSTGAEIEAAPDFVESNRYWSKDQASTGVLIMSVTVKKPDTYTLACHYQDGSSEPEIVVALGPNYVWEFFRVVGKISLAMFSAMTISCGSILIGLILVIIVVIKRRGL